MKKSRPVCSGGIMLVEVSDLHIDIVKNENYFSTIVNSNQIRHKLILPNHYIHINNIKVEMDDVAIINGFEYFEKFLNFNIRHLEIWV